MRNGSCVGVSRTQASGQAQRAQNVYQAYVEMMNDSIRESFARVANPFHFKHVQVCPGSGHDHLTHCAASLTSRPPLAPHEQRGSACVCTCVKCTSMQCYVGSVCYHHHRTLSCNAPRRSWRPVRSSMTWGPAWSWRRPPCFRAVSPGSSWRCGAGTPPTGSCWRTSTCKARWHESSPLTPRRFPASRATNCLCERR